MILLGLIPAIYFTSVLANKCCGPNWHDEVFETHEVCIGVKKGYYYDPKSQSCKPHYWAGLPLPKQSTNHFTTKTKCEENCIREFCLGGYHESQRKNITSFRLEVAVKGIPNMDSVFEGSSVDPYLKLKVPDEESNGNGKKKQIFISELGLWDQESFTGCFRVLSRSHNGPTFFGRQNGQGNVRWSNFEGENSITCRFLLKIVRPT